MKILAFDKETDSKYIIVYEWYKTIESLLLVISNMFINDRKIERAN